VSVPLRGRVAKKVRTPPPPRRVQAPQKRETRRAAGVPTRPPWVYAAAGAAAAAVIAAAVIAVVVLRDNGGGGAKTNTTAASYNALPGIRKTKAPWPPEYEFLADRLLPLGLTPLAQEQLAFHIHQHLDVFVDGKRVAVPQNIGINPGAGYLTELHTHDDSGIIHVESAEDRNYTLGQLFAEGGVFLNARCIGAYCNGLKWYVNGKPQTGNPQNLVLENHQEIAIVVGKRPKKIPTTYAWAAHGI
jgi:hypothetical protein